MTDLYHQKEFRLAIVSPSANLFGKSQNSLRAKLGLRARLTPFASIRDGQQKIRNADSSFEMVALDSACVTSLKVLPDFTGVRGMALPVLLLLRRGETDIAELAMEAGYKALLFTDDDAEFRQLFPAMTLRIIAQFRGELKRISAYPTTAEEQLASDLGDSGRDLAPKKFPHTRFIVPR